MNYLKKLLICSIFFTMLSSNYLSASLALAPVMAKTLAMGFKAGNKATIKNVHENLNLIFEQYSDKVIKVTINAETKEYIIEIDGIIIIFDDIFLKQEEFKEKLNKALL